jgi:hypothetical protein
MDSAVISLRSSGDWPVAARTLQEPPIKCGWVTRLRGENGEPGFPTALDQRSGLLIRGARNHVEEIKGNLLPWTPL